MTVKYKTCEHLKLIPHEDSQEYISHVINELKRGNPLPDDFDSHSSNVFFKFSCNKENAGSCTGLEIKSEYEPFQSFYGASIFLPFCHNREIPENNLNGELSLDQFLLEHVDI